MFDNLTDKLSNAFRSLKGQNKISESNIKEAMSEIRRALLEADVNYKVAKEFVSSVKEEALGAEVLKNVSPDQQLVKIVNDKLTEFMGESNSPLKFESFPSVILMVGLHGGGKTTTAAKLAAHLKKENKQPMLVAGDIYRPAAIDQIEILAKEIDVPVYSDRKSENVSLIAQKAVAEAKHKSCNTVIIDTAGRLQIDDDMVKELIDLKQTVGADDVLLVADAALGQEAVSVAEHFHKALNLTGFILTKLDGDARGGAALAIRKVTECPVKFVGVGEKIQDFEVFHPDRMASRILGMGDVVSLVEKASEEIDEKEAEKLRKKMAKNKFDFNDFLNQLKQLKKLGGIESLLKFLPGGKKISQMASFDPEQFKSMEAMIFSMTKKERENPEIIDFSRRKRIAEGSGNKTDAVSSLVKQFNSMRTMMKRTGLFKKLASGDEMDDISIDNMLSSPPPSKIQRGSNFTPPKSKKKKKKKKQKKKRNKKNKKKKKK